MTSTLIRRPQRGTLFLVCPATVMLMLDAAVAHTALPHLARDLRAGLTGIQVATRDFG